MTYIFELGNHTEQAHDYTSELIDEAYRRKADDKPVASHERVQKADELCEAHYAQIGQWPVESVLTRLAWYIVFDEMTDPHPDKVSREEYPVLSKSQEKRRQREVPSKNVYFDKRDYVGFRTVYEKDDREGSGRVRKYPIYNEASDKKAEKHVTGIDVMELLNNANLTERQREAIKLTFFDGLTQEQAAKVLGVQKSTINEHLTIALRKLREKAELLFD